MSSGSKDELTTLLESTFTPDEIQKLGFGALGVGAAVLAYWKLHAWLPLVIHGAQVALHVALVAAAVGLVAAVVLTAIRHLCTWQTQKTRVTRVPLVRPDFDPSEAQQAAFVSQVHGLRRRGLLHWFDAPASGIRVIMRTSKDGHPLYLWQLPRRNLRSLTSAVDGCFTPNAIKLEDAKDLLPPPSHGTSRRLELKPARRDDYPFRHIPTGLDPKSRFAQALASAHGVNPVIAIDHLPMPPQQWKKWVTSALRRTLDRPKKRDKGEAFRRPSMEELAAEALNRREQQALWRKVDDHGNRTPLFFVQVLVEARGGNRYSRQQAVEDMRGGFDQWTSENFFGAVGYRTGGSDSPWRSMHFDRRMRRGTIDSNRVMAGWELEWLLPWNKFCTYEEVVRQEAVRPQPPEAAIDAKGVGVTLLPEGHRVVLTPHNLRYHTHLQAPIGAGKSTTLGNMFLDFVDLGLPGASIDPNKGDTTRYILDRLPERHWKRVRLIDPSRTERVVGMNPLDVRDPNLHQTVAGQIAAIFDGVYRQYWTNKSAYFLKLAVRTLLEIDHRRREASEDGKVPLSTLADVIPLLGDDEVRKAWVQELQDDALEKAWSTYDPQEATSLVWKLNDVILLQPAVRNLLCQRESTMDLAEAVNGDGIILVTLPTGVISEDTASLLGSLIVSRLWQVIQGRGAIPEDQRRFFLAALDEFPKLVKDPTTWDEWTAEGRGYRAGLLLINQNHHQLAKAGVAETVAGPNVRNKLTFQTEYDDAAQMANQQRPLTASDITHLEPHHLAARLCIDGHVEPAYIGPVEGPRPPHGRGEEVARLALEEYGRPQKDVDAEATRAHAPVVESNGHKDGDNGRWKKPEGPRNWA